jgi:transposase
MNEQTTESQILFQAMKATKDKRMYERYQAVYLLLTGHSYKQVRAIVGRSEKSLYNYFKAYKEKGIEGLVMGVSTGAPRKLAPEQEKELVKMIVDHLPVDLGFPARHNWTLALIVSLIEREWKVTYPLRGASRLLHDLGLSYSKPSYTLANADPVKQAYFQERTFPALKKTSKRGD